MSDRNLDRLIVALAAIGAICLSANSLALIYFALWGGS